MQTRAQAIEGRWVEEDRGHDTPCWIWQRGKTTAGYSEVCVAGRVGYGHRIAYELHVGPIPEGLVIDHLCRQRDCINPAHLEPVTDEENRRRGGTMKLYESDVRQIRALAGRYCYGDLARSFGVSRSMIGLIVRRQRWESVT